MISSDDGLFSIGALNLQTQAQEQAALKEMSQRLDELQAQLWADERRLTGGGCL